MGNFTFIVDEPQTEPRALTEEQREQKRQIMKNIGNYDNFRNKN